MFQSGCVKLLGGDSAWHSLTALRYHYETQPLPTWIGWYAHQLPAWVQAASATAMFGIELFVPFLIFAPRRLRQWACLALVFFQVLIFLTGNYGFFNLLTITLCLLLLDDAALRAILPKRMCEALLAGSGRQDPIAFAGGRAFTQAQTSPANGSHAEACPPSPLESAPLPFDPQPPIRNARKWPVQVTVPLATIAVITSLMQFAAMFRLSVPWPRPMVAVYAWLEPSARSTITACSRS